MSVAIALPVYLFHRPSDSDQRPAQSYKVEVIDGCEYLRFAGSVVHKGNCTNVVHANRWPTYANH